MFVCRFFLYLQTVSDKLLILKKNNEKDYELDARRHLFRGQESILNVKQFKDNQL
jgi:hypothetical protein